MQAFCGQRLCNGLDLTGASYAATSPEYEYYSHNPKFGQMSKFEYEKKTQTYFYQYLDYLIKNASNVFSLSKHMNNNHFIIKTMATHSDRSHTCRLIE